ncbi:hypothetical protein BN1080_00328 [Planococcus massiliensis]|uniref:Uncharacterized protein n=1 Tax=Planococcus massiliensis TaxID=1499687 RepID=A0A098EGK7_9BACL|nr:hypothetical protein BN1080_00328 [Planococcus massiliensis]
MENKESKTKKESESLTYTHMRTIGRVCPESGLSKAYYRDEFHQIIDFDSQRDFVVWIWENNFTKMNPYEILALLWTGQNADISANLKYGEILRSIKKHSDFACVITVSIGLFCTAEDNR